MTCASTASSLARQCPLVSPLPARLTSIRIDSSASGHRIASAVQCSATRNAPVCCHHFATLLGDSICTAGTESNGRNKQRDVHVHDRRTRTDMHIVCTAGSRRPYRHSTHFRSRTERLQTPAWRCWQPAAAHRAVFAAAAGNATPPDGDPNGASSSADASADDADAAQQRRRDVWERAAQLHAERQVGTVAVMTRQWTICRKAWLCRDSPILICQEAKRRHRRCYVTA
jgi:hypothetical protein